MKAGLQNLARIKQKSNIAAVRPFYFLIIISPLDKRCFYDDKRLNVGISRLNLLQTPEPFFR